MPYLQFEGKKVGLLRMQMQDPKLAVPIRQLEDQEPIRFHYEGMELVDHSASKAPHDVPYFFEWQQIELWFEADRDHSFRSPFEIRINGQASGLISRFQGQSQKLFGSLNLKDAVGYTDLELRDADGVQVFYIQIEVFPQKLNYKRDFHHMVEEINRIIRNLAFDYLRKTYALVQASDQVRPEKLEWWMTFRMLFDSIRQSLDRILRTPHREIKEQSYIRPIEKIRRIPTARLATWMARYPQYQGQFLPERLRISTYDTYENRFVTWAIRQIIEQSQSLYSLLSKTDQRLLSNWLQVLKQRLNHPVFKEVGKFQPKAGYSPVLQQAEGYRNFYLYFLLLRKGLRLNKQALIQLDYKSVATLYEYWVYLKTIEILKEDPHFEMEKQDLVRLRHDQLGIGLNKGEKAKVTFRRKDQSGMVQLWYNRAFGEQESPTFVQKPDIFLESSQKSGAEPVRFVIDAKYRFDRGSQSNPSAGIPFGPPLDAISQLHRYRDAIISDPQQHDSYRTARKSLGGLVLFPYPELEQKFKDHRFYKSLRKVHIGAIPLSPSKGAKHELYREFLKQLLHSAPEALHEQVIEYRKRDLRQMVEECNSQVIIANLQAEFKASFRNSVDQKSPTFSLALSEKVNEAEWLVIYDAEESGLIGFGKIAERQWVNGNGNGNAIESQGLMDRAAVMVQLRLESWADFMLSFSGMPTEALFCTHRFALRLAMELQREDPLYLPDYVWCRMWQDVYSLDPDCRWDSQFKAPALRFVYNEKKWRVLGGTNSRQFRLLPEDGPEQYYELGGNLWKCLET